MGGSVPFAYFTSPIMKQITFLRKEQVKNYE